MIRKPVILVTASACLLFAACNTSQKVAGNVEKLSLKEAFENDFLIGTALNTAQILEQDSLSAKVIPEHFNAVTPENIMKAEEIQPSWGNYRFDLADRLVDYAKRYNMEVNGHTLIWHSQLPQYVRGIKDADSVRQFFTSHINTVASRYKGKVHTWDVVNEALNEDGTLRKSIFLEKLGEDYIVEAFRLTQKAAPDAKLYYNDYNIEQPAKRAGAIRIIKKIQEAGVRIDGVGIQGHWNINNIPLKHIEDAIIEFAALGVEVMFTELDVSVLPNPFGENGAEVSLKADYKETMNPYSQGLPDSVEQKLTDGYEKIFRIFLKHKEKISRVTLWGVSDAQSWLNDWPIRGRTNYPLLFDRQLQAKPALHRVIGLKKDNALNEPNKDTHASR